MTTTMQTSAPLRHQQLDARITLVRELVRMVNDGYLTLDAPYQRGSVWTVRQQRDLVRSMLLGLPVPAIITNARWKTPGFDHQGPEFEVAVIDGKQRLTAAIAWFGDELSVPASWFEPEHVETAVDTDDGPYVTFTGLTIARRRHATHRMTVPVAEASVRSIAAEAAIYGLVNGGGVQQTEQDMARAARIAATEQG